MKPLILQAQLGHGSRRQRQLEPDRRTGAQGLDIGAVAHSGFSGLFDIDRRQAGMAADGSAVANALFCGNGMYAGHQLLAAGGQTVVAGHHDKRRAEMPCHMADNVSFAERHAVDFGVEHRAIKERVADDALKALGAVVTNQHGGVKAALQTLGHDERLVGARQQCRTGVELVNDQGCRPGLCESLTRISSAPAAAAPRIAALTSLVIILRKKP